MTAAIIEAYREIGNIKKVAKHLHISQQKVSDTIREAGLGKAKKQPNSSKAQCFTCDNAYADKCAFMRADIDGAEAVLAAIGARYESKTYAYRYMQGTREVTLLTVLECPKYARGECGGMSETIDGAKASAIRRETLEGALVILLRNTFCFMNEVECPGQGPENCEACARGVLGLK